jgi:hypothetical protein
VSTKTVADHTSVTPGDSKGHGRQGIVRVIPHTLFKALLYGIIHCGTQSKIDELFPDTQTPLQSELIAQPEKNMTVGPIKRDEAKKAKVATREERKLSDQLKRKLYDTEQKMETAVARAKAEKMVLQSKLLEAQKKLAEPSSERQQELLELQSKYNDALKNFSLASEKIKNLGEAKLKLSKAEIEEKTEKEKLQKQLQEVQQHLANAEIQAQDEKIRLSKELEETKVALSLALDREAKELAENVRLNAQLDETESERLRLKKSLEEAQKTNTESACELRGQYQALKLKYDHHVQERRQTVQEITLELERAKAALSGAEEERAKELQQARHRNETTEQNYQKELQKARQALLDHEIRMQQSQEEAETLRQQNNNLKGKLDEIPMNLQEWKALGKTLAFTSKCRSLPLLDDPKNDALHKLKDRTLPAVIALGYEKLAEQYKFWRPQFKEAWEKGHVAGQILASNQKEYTEPDNIDGVNFEGLKCGHLVGFNVMKQLMLTRVQEAKADAIQLVRSRQACPGLDAPELETKRCTYLGVYITDYHASLEETYNKMDNLYKQAERAARADSESKFLCSTEIDVEEKAMEFKPFDDIYRNLVEKSAQDANVMTLSDESLNEMLNAVEGVASPSAKATSDLRSQAIFRPANPTNTASSAAQASDQVRMDLRQH